MEAPFRNVDLNVQNVQNLVDENSGSLSPFTKTLVC